MSASAQHSFNGTGQLQKLGLKATKEGQRAVQHHATQLFGSEAYARALQESWELPARAVCALALGRVFFSPTRRHPRRFRISNDLNFRKLVLLSWQSCARLNCSSSLITALMLCSSSNSQACAALVSSKGDATIEEMSHGQADTIRLQACYIILS